MSIYTIVLFLHVSGAIGYFAGIGIPHNHCPLVVFPNGRGCDKRPVRRQSDVSQVLECDRLACRLIWELQLADELVPGNIPQKDCKTIIAFGD